MYIIAPADTGAAGDPVPMSNSALRDCQFASWYERYAPLAPESAIIPLSDEFAAFLASRHWQGPAFEEDAWFPHLSPAEDGAVAAAQQPAWQQQFPEVHASIEAAIQRLGGAVAPKLNWSSPTDADAPLGCTSAHQVVQLLSQSKRVAYDVQLIQELRQQQRQPDQYLQPACPTALTAAAPTASSPSPLTPHLVLRRWHSLLPDNEFRCFVHHHRPTAVCQRDHGRYFPGLQDKEYQEELRDAICNFHAHHFGSGFARSSYMLDVYVDPATGAVRLIDVNPIADADENAGAAPPANGQPDGPQPPGVAGQVPAADGRQGIGNGAAGDILEVPHEQQQGQQQHGDQQPLSWHNVPVLVVEAMGPPAAPHHQGPVGAI